jgi:hypothetical protein
LSKRISDVRVPGGSSGIGGIGGIAPPTPPALLRDASVIGSVSNADTFARDAGREKSFLLPLSKVKREGRLFVFVEVLLDVDALL